MSIIESPTTRTEFKTLLKNNSDKIIFVRYSAEWCGPCKKIKDRVFELYNNYKGDKLMILVDADKHSDVFASMKIKSIPTIQTFKEGYPDRVVVNADIDLIKDLFRNN